MTPAPLMKPNHTTASKNEESIMMSTSSTSEDKDTGADRLAAGASPRDALGDRIKAYELAETGRMLMPYLPIIGRIDGRCFSSFTHGMARPYDPRLHACFVETASQLVKETQALAAYTQSDEITLLWYGENPETQTIFGGKPFKMMSVAASLTTSIFSRIAQAHWPEKLAAKPVSFDCRIFQVPNKDEAANAFLWRELDATKNAISMAARHYHSHKELHQKSSAQMQEMLFARGVNFNDYPDEFKRGTFILRKTVFKELEPEVLARIPEAHRPTGPIERQIIAAARLPKFSTITNRVDVLFDGAEPVMKVGNTDSVTSALKPKSSGSVSIEEVSLEETRGKL